MLNSLQGVLTGRSEHYVFIENSGLEWTIETSLICSSRLGKVGDKVKILLHLHHKEDQMSLYGFLDLKERELFQKLITVSGIGPKGAVKILSAMDSSRFISALELEDITTLSSIPGLGKKTAQKIILQLRGKLAPKESMENEKLPDGHLNELTDSLSQMGFERKAVIKQLKELMEKPELTKMELPRREEELMRQAIIALSQGGAHG